MAQLLNKSLIFFTGKGGVGKSALAWGTALAAVKAGKKVSLISWNPFDSTGKPLPAQELGIRWHILDSVSCFHEYALGILKFEKIYELIFQNKVLKAFVEAAPGLAETVIAGKIWDLTQKEKDSLLIVDLPASGHALTFFSSPLGLNKLFSLGIIHRETDRIKEMFFSEKTRVDLVTLPEELPMTETAELHGKLSDLKGLRLGYLHVNQCLPEFGAVEGQSPWVERYRDAKDQEVLSLAQAAKIGMPILRIPKMTANHWLGIVKQIAAHLEDTGSTR